MAQRRWEGGLRDAPGLGGDDMAGNDMARSASAHGRSWTGQSGTLICNGGRGMASAIRRFPTCAFRASDGSVASCAVGTACAAIHVDAGSVLSTPETSAA